VCVCAFVRASEFTKVLGDVAYLGWTRTVTLYVYTVYKRYFKQGNHHAYGHIRCVYTVLANPA